MMKGRGMLFKEFKQRALALLREAEGQGMLDVRGSIAKRRNELRAQFTQGLETGIERNRRILQLKRLGFYLLVNQWATYCLTEEKWEQLFDQVEKVTKEETQKVLEEEERQSKEREKKRRLLSNIPKKVRAKLPSKIIRKIKTGDYLLSPRSYNYITLKTKRGEGEVKLPNYSFKAEALIDFMFHKIAEQLDFGADPSHAIIPGEEFKKICKGAEDSPIFKPIVFTTSEIRKKLNVSWTWTDEKIVEAARELRREEIKANNVRTYAEKGGKYHQRIDWYTGICSDVLVNKTDKIAPKKKNVQHKIAFIPGLITSLLFYNDVINRRYSLFPTEEKRFYTMGEGPVRLYRYLSLWDFTILTMPMAMEILRYSEKTNVTQMCRQVQSHLDKLADQKLIEFWMRDTSRKGMKTIWYVFVTQTIEQVFGCGKEKKPKPKV